MAKHTQTQNDLRLILHNVCDMFVQSVRLYRTLQQFAGVTRDGDEHVQDYGSDAGARMTDCDATEQKLQRFVCGKTIAHTRDEVFELQHATLATHVMLSPVIYNK